MTAHTKGTHYQFAAADFIHTYTAEDNDSDAVATGAHLEHPLIQMRYAVFLQRHSGKLTAVKVLPCSSQNVRGDEHRLFAGNDWMRCVLAIPDLGVVIIRSPVVGLIV